MSHYYDTVSRAVEVPVSKLTARETNNSPTPDSFDLLAALVRQMREAETHGDYSRLAHLAATARQELHHLMLGRPEQETHCALLTRHNGRIKPTDGRLAEELSQVVEERVS